MNELVQTVRIQLDYLQGPIWISNIESGETFTGIESIDNDPIIQDLNRQAGQLYSSFFEFGVHDQACWFNKEKEKEQKDKLIGFIQSILLRLNELNDGSFVVEDCESKRLMEL